ncbi:DNA adenine methylase [Limosilactobacillus fermentum]|uniref:DNA adenine methylase n=1 Tax=Limosilactobacillus fermentum TaxID=1613 RepID=UPI00224302F6|nr:DNA adenine methylase [Limosilactobacillus fermentum]UZM84670.1 DNA adenine methylase [Limosilactobacillus fermentum]
MMDSFRSPLRYPGGKIKLAPLIKEILNDNPAIKNYVEPFAGGAGIAINLLLHHLVEHITLNDLDSAIFAFWKAVTEQSSDFLELFDSTEISISEWKHQKEIFDSLDSSERLNDSQLLVFGFSTFYLNRTNFSGIIRGATPVGGMNQNGKWKIDYEFNKARLRPLLIEIGKHSNHIDVVNYDMISGMSELSAVSDKYSPEETLMFIDPPYVNQGRRLYLPINSMTEHEKVAQQVKNLDCKWILTYDEIPELIDLYSFTANRYLYTLQYRVRTHRLATEFIAGSENLNLQSSSVIQISREISDKT